MPPVVIGNPMPMRNSKGAIVYYLYFASQNETGDKIVSQIKWRQPRKVFVNSMSDLFHPDVPTSFIKEVFDVMGRADWPSKS